MLAAMLFALLGTQARANGHDSMDLLLQESQVYAASRYTQAIEQTPANVYVLGRDEIRRFGYRSINEALRAVPGLYNAASQWPAFGVRGVAVPGDFGSRILYLVNGMPMYEATYGGFFLEYLDIESIDRIELIKGAGSALYGSGAVQAVVNLVTRSGQTSPGESVSLELASERARKIYGSIGSHQERSDSFISASLTDISGRDVFLRELNTPAFNSARYGGVSIDHDDSRTLRLFGRLAGQGRWLQGLLISGRKSDPLASYNTVLNGSLRLRETLGAFEAGMIHDLTNGASLTARAYYFEVSEEGDYPYAFSGDRGADADFINVSDLSSRQLGVEVRYDKFLPGGQHLLAGVELKRVTSRQRVGDQPGLERAGVIGVDSSPDYSISSVFLQNEMPFGRDRLFLGARLDSYHGYTDGVNSRLSPRVAYVHPLSDKTTAKLVYGEAYRAPTLYESSYQDGLPDAETIWANPSLRPELSRSLELLIEQQFAERSTWKLAAFINRLKNTPVQVVTPTLNGVNCRLGPTSCIQYRNSGATQHVYGIEADVRSRFAGDGYLYSSLVLQRSRFRGSELPASPRVQVKAGVAHPLPWHGLNGALEAHYIGRALGRQNPDGSRTASVSSHLLLNAALNTGPLPGGWRASLRATNLLDREVYTVASSELQPLERVPAPGRQFSLQFQLDF